MMIKKECCAHCSHGTGVRIVPMGKEYVILGSRSVTCKRYPEYTQKDAADHCGEFTPRSNDESKGLKA